MKSEPQTHQSITNTNQKATQSFKQIFSGDSLAKAIKLQRLSYQPAANSSNLDVKVAKVL